MKKYKIIFWITTGIIFLVEGVMPLSTLFFAPEHFNTGTKPLGYPDYFAYALIISKTLGATAIMLPKLSGTLREWAYAGLTFNLIYAVFSHAVVDGKFSYILSPIIVGIILAISYVYNRKIKLYGKNKL
ncbi:MAG: DoxX family protein [Bacteroidales bacterium]|jgi:uncharacterized membrane protein YphA (DoxX/SURF4 family)|nr:DoxX family protein [Bacteroidales bacterium]HOI32879.1 DoxX family protein [Bacteroidales bacterium]